MTATAAPTLESLLRRVTACPSPFLEPPRAPRKPGVHSDALVYDTLRDHYDTLPSEDALASLRADGPEQFNHMHVVQICCWLLAAPDLVAVAHDKGNEALNFMRFELRALAKLVRAEACIHDPDRREELVRLVLQAVGVRAAGESEAQAQDRLQTLDSVERDRILRQTRAQEEHARQLREALKRQQAEEAAGRYSRE